ncbi:Fibrobacter succinogenes major domain (Fib_succ_major) [Elizabethkingia miricola]|nr:Fibrobacter succinogenes major domain (Fib_succ_major) [Elizabethkingia miricola]
MKLNLRKIGNRAVVFLFLCMISCRTTDKENNLMGGGAASVKINFSGTVYDESANSKASSRKMEVQKKMIMVNPSTFIEVEIAPDNTPQGRSVRASETESLKDQSKFRIIAYDKASGNYKTHKDYFFSNGILQVTEGDDLSLILDGGVTYTIVTYSFGINYLPKLSDQEQSNINTAQIDYNDANVQDFMYEKQEFTPVGGNNILKILLKHKVAQLTPRLNTGPYVNVPIEKIANASLSPHYNTGTIFLSNGTIVNTTPPGNATVSFTDVASANKVASPVFINANTKDATGSFKADITINGATQTLNTGAFFSITPGTRKNLNINVFIKCKAYLGPNQTEQRDFMCHNLGADTSVNPFIPSAEIHGAKYQWGAHNHEIGRYVSQAEDQANLDISGWNETGKPADSWLDERKTLNDPCPEGYRVPTSAQWQAIIDYNIKIPVGNGWDIWTNNLTNFGTGIMLGNSLFLPTEGHRSFQGGLVYRGNVGGYWTSTVNENNVNADYVYFTNSTLGVSFSGFTTGNSLRCIAEK